MKANLYFVVAACANGENYDLFVRAETVESAIKGWRKYYGLSKDSKPDRTYAVPAKAGLMGAVPWSDVLQTINYGNRKVEVTE